MKKVNTKDGYQKLKKMMLIFISVIIIIVVVVVLFISPITKYLVEKYDKKYTGREITMDWAYTNPFTGYIHLSNLKIHELNSDSVFFSANGVSANFAMHKLFSKTYEISELTLNQPQGMIIQSNKDFNFNDLIAKFTGDSDTAKAPVHFNILNIKINDGEFYYHDKIIPVSYSIKKVNFESTGKRWDVDTLVVKFSFLPGIGSGDMKGDFTIDVKNLDYRLAVVANKYDLNFIEQYLEDLTNYGSFSANLDADMKLKGNFNEQEEITSSGLLAINDFHFGKNPDDDYASFEKLVFAINKLSPKDHIYFYDSISLSRPYFKYERYDYLDNLQNMFGKDGANIDATKANPARFNLVIEIANYIEVLSRNFFRSDYKINRLAIYNGNIKFNDYSLSEKFALELNPLSVIADSIDKNHKRVKVSLKSGIKPYGDLSVALSINPKDSSDFDLQYNFQKAPLSMFNPYIISYTSFPLNRGTIEFNGTWNVRNGIIQSNNHLLIIDPRLGKLLRNKDTKWVPAPLIMAFVREGGNVIDYEIPITGNLKNPEFNLKDVFFDLLENIFVKPPTMPHRIKVKNIETEIEKSLALSWPMRHSSLLPDQEKFIEKMADFLVKNPEASITVYPQQYAIKEKEYILFYEAKKKYFLSVNNKNTQSFNEEDSEKVDKMLMKDSLFVNYLNKQANNSMIFTIQEKCAVLIDLSVINAKFQQLNKERENAFISYFKKSEVENRIKFSKGENLIPYNGFSFYKIEYKGEFPESLTKAYQQMNKINDDELKKIFNKDRKKSGSTLYEKTI